MCSSLMSLQTKSSKLKEVCKRAEEIIAIPWHRLVWKWGKRFMVWFDQSALYIWCKILISCSIEIYTMSKGKYSATFMLFNLGWKSWRMTNTARFLLHLFPNESSLTFAHRALLVRGVIVFFFPFFFIHSIISSETLAQRQLYHHECFYFCSLLYSGNWQKMHNQQPLTHFFSLQIFIHKPETNHQNKNGIFPLPPHLGQGEGRAGSCTKVTRVDKHRIICGFKNSKYNEIQKTVEKTKNLKRATANDNLNRQHI